MLCCVLLTHEIQSSVCCSVRKDYFLSGGEGFPSGKNKRNKYVYEGAAWMFLCEYKLLHVLITDYSFTVTDLRPSRSRRLRFSFLVCLFGLNDCGSNVRQLQEEALGSSSWYHPCFTHYVALYPTHFILSVSFSQSNDLFSEHLSSAQLWLFESLFSRMTFDLIRNSAAKASSTNRLHFLWVTQAAAL